MQTNDTGNMIEKDYFIPGFEAINSVSRLIDLALDEDIATGDVTTDSIVPPGSAGKASITAKEALLVAGMDVAAMVFSRLDPGIAFETICKDGTMAEPGQTLARISGELRPLLWGERTALNFLQRLSGIATNTRSHVEETKGLDVRLVDTRKTTPGWRMLEKYAVRVGGADNHRMGLFDGILIKDNHIAAAGGIDSAVARARAGAPHMLRIEVEASDMEQVAQALEAGADIIMLDNMDVDQIRQAVNIIDKKALVEVSGGVTKKRIKILAQAGVNILSCGALTHAARSMDISMNITA